MSFDLDHVALGLTDIQDTLFGLAADLGATPIRGGQMSGFRAMQVRVGDAERGMNVELLEPFDSHLNNFLERFIGIHGDGPHHMTFKVADIRTELDRLYGLGFQPVGVNLDNDVWKEAFIPPKQAHGTVVQIAQPGMNPSIGELLAASEEGNPMAMHHWWPEPPIRASKRAFLERVVLKTPNVAAAHEFYVGVLNGQPQGECRSGCRIAWPGGGQIALEPGEPLGIDRLEISEAPFETKMLGGTRFVADN